MSLRFSGRGWLWCVFAIVAVALAVQVSTRAVGQAPASGSPAGSSSSGVSSGIDKRENINYAGSNLPRQTLDLYLPTTPGKHPLVIWIHGGGWRAGSKDRCGYTYLVNDGYAVASINYRLSVDATFPAQIHDCKGAVRFLRANAAKYGIDPERVGVIGGSAGGHLAALLGTTADVKELEGNIGGNLTQSSRVQAVVDLFGPTVLYSDRREDHLRLDFPGNPLWNLFGGQPSKMQELAKQASPLFHVTKDDAPILMLHGTRDIIVELLHSEKLRDACVEQEIDHRLIVMEGAAHGGPQFGDDAARTAIREFFGKHLAQKK